MDEQFADFQFPAYGIDRTRSNQEQPAGSTILGQNVRTFEPSTGRGRGGSRPGVLPYVNDPLPGAIQNITSVVTVDGTALLANYDDTPPDLYDPSDFGGFPSWPPGRESRTPNLGIPDGGWGVPPWKNAPQTVNIVWPSAGTIGVGTALGASQLNAAAQDRISGDSVSGTFTYSPGSGTVLPIGNAQELLTRFVPDDTDRYGVTYGFNAINVIQSEDGNDIEFVQVWSLASGGSSQQEVVMPSSVTEGNLLIAAVVIVDDSTTTVGVITDTQGNVWSQAGSYAEFTYTGTKYSVSIWYAIAGTSGPVTLRVTPDADVTSIVIDFFEYTNNDEAPLNDADATTDTGSASDTVSTPVISVASEGDLIFAVWTIVSNGIDGDNATGVLTGFNDRGSFSSGDLITGTSQAASVAVTVVGTLTWAVALAAASFRKAD